MFLKKKKYKSYLSFNTANGVLGIICRFAEMVDTLTRLFIAVKSNSNACSESTVGSVITIYVRLDDVTHHKTVKHVFTMSTKTYPLDPMTVIKTTVVAPKAWKLN